MSLKSFLAAIFGPPANNLASAGRNTKPPINIPFKIAVAGTKLSTDLTIAEHNIYSFSLQFFFRGNDKEDRGRVQKLTGSAEMDATGKPVEPGVPTPVCLKVFAIKPKATQELLIYEENVDPIMTIPKDDHFKKPLGDLELKPGQYRVQVETLQNASEWTNFRIAFAIANDHYTSFTPAR